MKIISLSENKDIEKRVAITPEIVKKYSSLGFEVSLPKNYASHTSMLIQETAKMNPFLEDLAVSSMLDEQMSALKALLNSRHILGAVAASCYLYCNFCP